MIRPFTVVCFMMAVGSGLYLYQCKHQAQMLDREIGRTIKQTDAARDRIGILRAEWAQLNEPERVAELARAHTTLQTAKPTQFMAVADLAARLPAPVAPSRQAPQTDMTEEEPPAAVAQAEPPARAVPSAAAEARSDARPEPRAVAVAGDPKPVRHAARAAAPDAKPVIAVAAVSHAVVLPRIASAASANAEATAPGTVGAAVLRAMRAREAPSAAYVQPIVAPSYTPPAYQPPAYQPPAYQPQAAAAPAGSMLGGSRGVLPPPVPFAAR